MMTKNESKVLIGGNVYTLSGDESEEYLQRVALYMNKKMDEVRNSDNGKKLNTRLQSVLLAINIADDYFKIRTQVDEVNESMKRQSDEMITLKNRVLELEQVQTLAKQKNTQLENEIIHYKKELDDYIQLFEQSNNV